MSDQWIVTYHNAKAHANTSHSVAISAEPFRSYKNK